MRLIAKTTLAILAGGMVGVILIAVIKTLKGRLYPVEETEKHSQDRYSALTDETIARRAYQLWQARLQSGIEGSAEQCHRSSEIVVFEL